MLFLLPWLLLKFWMLLNGISQEWEKFKSCEQLTTGQKEGKINLVFNNMLSDILYGHQPALRNSRPSTCVISLIFNPLCGGQMGLYNY